ncbi:MarR family transcriptional regulator [Enterococcus sp. JM4C]|uniref:MarR family winged helix-turn-helix transcriptional regulator n=1 Tax=Candidatus Enterococcus huntleyi TaxID=1857217 RepID=UPI00137AECC4|nr:MarR family transcriptional regulator [Enterococcus sp. JM4C]KAF1298151.1 MarR family transcriptional regulator [Enterococcus sp. JM4C]
MESILRDIGVIARALDSIANIEFKEFELTRGQYVYLVRIYENKGIIPEQLAEMIKVDRSTASRAIQRLVEKGFVTKVLDQENKKIIHLETTDKGAEKAAFILRENKYSKEAALQGLTKQEQKVLHELLIKVKKNVDEDWHFVKSGGKRTY